MLKFVCFSFCMLFHFSHTLTYNGYEIEQPEGSFSMGHYSESTGNTGESVADYMTGASSWNPRSVRPRDELGFEVLGEQVPQLISNSVSLIKQAPYLEILKLVENILKFKGRVGNLLWNLWNDNTHIITALKNTLITKISTIHNLTLTAIIILRKILEFASSLFKNNIFSANTVF